MLGRPHLIFMIALLFSAVIVFSVNRYEMAAGQSAGTMASYGVFTAVGVLGFLSLLAIVLRHRFGSVFSLVSAATLIQGISIALMILGISLPIKAMLDAGANMAPEDLLQLVSPLSQSLITMASGVFLAVLLNFLDTSDTCVPHIDVRLGDVDTTHLSASLATLGGVIGKLHTQISELMEAVEESAGSFEDLGNNAAKLKTAIDHTGTLLEQINIFVNATRGSD